MMGVRLCFASILVATLGLIGQAWPQDLPRARPESVGFDSGRLDYIDQFYSKKVEAGEMAGIVTLISRHGKVVHFSAVGYADLETKRRMETDTIFRLFSMTKPIASVALMMLYEEGRFELQDPLSKYIPEFANLRVSRDPSGPLDETVALARAPTVEDVMRHTAGFTHGIDTDAFDEQYKRADLFGLEVTLEEMMGKLAKIPLRTQPETEFRYSLGPDVAARLVEVLSGMQFDEFLKKRLFKPLGMKDTGFWMTPDKANRLATVYWAKNGHLAPGYPTEKLAALPWLANTYTVDHKHKGGSAGLASTAEDYWRFGQMMLNEGQLNGTRILAPQIVKFMTRDHLGRIPFDPKITLRGIGFGLGFAVVKDPGAAGYMSSEGSYFWSGGANTHFWVDPKEDMVVVAMAQDMEVPATEELWSQIRTLVYSALAH